MKKWQMNILILLIIINGMVFIDSGFKVYKLSNNMQQADEVDVAPEETIPAIDSFEVNNLLEDFVVKNSLTKDVWYLQGMQTNDISTYDYQGVFYGEYEDIVHFVGDIQGVEGVQIQWVELSGRNVSQGETNTKGKLWEIKIKAFIIGDKK